MEKRKIGSLEVSVVGLGCNNFGWRINASATAKVVHAAFDAGVNFFDTADRYATGQSEEYLGRAVRGHRQEVLLATKFGMEMELHEEKGASPAYVRSAVDASLRRLGTDYIDLYQLHQPDPETPIAETLGALHELVRAGKVREIGCSNFSVAQLREAEETAQGRTSFVSVQNEFSLFERAAEADVLSECERAGLTFLPFFPLANGLLTGKYRAGQKAPKGSRATEDWGPKVFTEENLATVEKLIAFAETRGHTILELAFAWLLAHRPVASVIAGASKPEQVRANGQAAGWQLTADDLAEIDHIVPARS
ncbi:MAG TPA: aldo/keto reductase [Chthoniobacterales bacterium]|nr:aldo/keto reductase [Chthoniobacterales bacterium]